MLFLIKHDQSRVIKPFKRDSNQSDRFKNITRDIGAGASKFFGVRRIFSRISPNLLEIVCATFCANVFSCRPCFGMTSKKKSSCPSANVGRLDFHGFLPNQNFWECAFTLCTPDTRYCISGLHGIAAASTSLKNSQ